MQGWLGLDELDDWINITSPAQGEVWRKGQNYAIEWDVVPGVSNVLIHLYKYTGGTWQNIITVHDSYPDNGYYYPFNPGDDWEEGQIYQIRMANVDGTASYGESGSFYVAGDLIMTAPTSNMSPFHPGDEIPVTWDRTGMSCGNPIANVRLDVQFSTNGGGTWSLYSPINGSAPNTGNLAGVIVYDWNTSYDYRIAISNSGSPWLPQGMVWDYSDPFNVVVNPTITVTDPNGGEEWVMGTNVVIHWTSSNLNGNVVIDLYRNGNFYEECVNSTVNDGTYNYSLDMDYQDGYGYKIRVSSSDDSNVYDESDSPFSIVNPPTITVTQPNGGEIWEMGETRNIVWGSTVSTGNLKIELYRNGSFVDLIEPSVALNGLTPWSIETGYDPGDGYRIRITSLDFPNIWDESDASFTLNPVSYLTVVSPNGGEVWQMGTEHQITWDSNLGGNVSIDLAIPPETTIRSIHGSAANNGSYTWMIETDLIPADNYLIKITPQVNVNAYDLSDGTFTITEASPDPFVTVTYPNGGEIWNLGEEQTITWDDNFDENVMIELYLGQVVMWVEPDTPSDGEYLYTPTMLPESSDYWIKISKVDEPVVNDSSDGPFTIQPPGPDLTFIMTPYTTVLPPNGGWVYYSVSLTNGGGPLMGLTYWTDALLPDGTLYPNRPETYGPFNLPGGYDNPSIQRQVFVPAAAPAGEYVYYGRIGYDPNIEVQDSFTFTKMANGALGTGGDFDWPTQYGHSLVPDLAGEAGQNVSVEMPSEYAVSIYPNPFNPTLTASISMPESGDLSVRVFGIDGRLIAELAHGSFEQGHHQLVFDGIDLASGVYFIQATVPGKMNVVRKAILLR